VKAVLAPVGSRGDVQPMVALGQRMRAAGHDVTLPAGIPTRELPSPFAGRASGPVWLNRATLAPLPSDLQGRVHVTGFWFLDSPEPLPDDLEAFLDGGEPPPAR
jgi:hypothetical protein